MPKRCDRCQRYKPVPNLPVKIYHLQDSPWPFMQWVSDIVGLLPPVPAKKNMMIVPTDYFTKWIEAETLSSIKEADVERFIWRNIICRFGCPQSLVTDKQSLISSVLRETQGDDQSVLRETQGICLQNTTVVHKQRPSGDAGQRPEASFGRRSP